MVVVTLRLTYSYSEPGFISNKLLLSFGLRILPLPSSITAPTSALPKLIALGAGGATGVGLKIKTSAGVQQFPKNTTPTPIEFAINGDGAHQLNYIASYVPLRADATIGRADATVDFTVQYE